MTTPFADYEKRKRRHKRLTMIEERKLELIKKQAILDMPELEIIEPDANHEAVFIWLAVILIAVLFSGGIL